jgi:uncharacterized protein YndB with AHSA1/START domain
MSLVAADREIVIEREFDAPREQVFRAWTAAEHLDAWWGPNGFTTKTHEMDFRPGGVWRNTMHGPDGTDYPNKVVYHEILAPERLAYTLSGDGETEDETFEVVVEFAEAEGKTRVTMRSLFPSAAARTKVVEEHGAIEGGKQTLARLAEYVRSL